MNHRLSRSLFVLAICIGCWASAPLAFGDSYTYSTTGTFQSSGGATASFLGTATSLTFNNVSTTVSGGDISLGTLSLFVDPQSTIGDSYTDNFTLGVTFTDPSASGNPFKALLSGNVFFDAGGATMTFHPLTQTFTEADGTSFTLTLDQNPVQVSTSNPVADIRATINPISAPEPSSALLLGIGLLGAGKIRRRQLSY